LASSMSSTTWIRWKNSRIGIRVLVRYIDRR
jgi:hypothetical protein